MSRFASSIIRSFLRGGMSFLTRVTVIAYSAINLFGEILAESMLYFDDTRYELHDFVIMPNHVHAFLRPFDGHDLSEILHSWKSFTANKINDLSGRKGRLWMPESYNHIVRSEAQFMAYQRYIAENPQKAGLRTGQFTTYTSHPGS
jgi:REP element-mobilizing transposase RayT